MSADGFAPDRNHARMLGYPPNRGIAASGTSTSGGSAKGSTRERDKPARLHVLGREACRAGSTLSGQSYLGRPRSPRRSPCTHADRPAWPEARADHRATFSDATVNNDPKPFRHSSLRRARHFAEAGLQHVSTSQRVLLHISTSQGFVLDLAAAQRARPQLGARQRIVPHIRTRQGFVLNVGASNQLSGRSAKTGEHHDRRQQQHGRQQQNSKRVPRHNLPLSPRLPRHRMRLPGEAHHPRLLRAFNTCVPRTPRTDARTPERVECKRASPSAGSVAAGRFCAARRGARSRQRRQTEKRFARESRSQDQHVSSFFFLSFSRGRPRARSLTASPHPLAGRGERGSLLWGSRSQHQLVSRFFERPRTSEADRHPHPPYPDVRPRVPPLGVGPAS